VQSQLSSFFPRPLSRQQVRAVDQQAIEQYGMTGLVLMENAGRGAAEWIAQQAAEGPLGILGGKGNNAGDGYVIARHLQLLGRQPTLLQISDPAGLRGDAAANWEIAQRSHIPSEIGTPTPARLQEFSVLVDALLGTGVTGAPRAPFDEVIRQANGCRAQRIAVDIPSGLDGDSGEPADPCFQAEVTLSFVASKRGFTKENAAPFVGRVVTLPIGVPLELLQAVDREAGNSR
jgi:NAD(P)H-hydrate epimerase